MNSHNIYRLEKKLASMKTMQVCIGFAENPEYLVKQVGLVELSILLSTVKATVFNPSLKHTKES